VVFGGVAATHLEKVQEPPVTGLTFVHSTVADA